MIVFVAVRLAGAVMADVLPAVGRGLVPEMATYCGLAASPFELAVSNPAFEFWFLLHFEETTRPFHNADELRKALEQHLPGYKKNQDLSAQLAPHTKAASTRSARASRT